MQEVTEVRHDLEDTRVEQSTVLVGRRHDAAVVAAMELQQGCCNVRLGLAHAIEERREWAHDRAVVLERCGQAALETGVQLVTARGVEREARRPSAPQAIDQRELASAHEIAGSGSWNRPMYQLFFHCFEWASERRRVAGCGIASVTARRTCDGAAAHTV